jgi:cbb3-type cytochrome oxidase subunit 3
MIEWIAQYSGYAILIAFFSAFVGIAAWIYRPKNRAKIEEHRLIPFKEADKNG